MGELVSALISIAWNLAYALGSVLEYGAGVWGGVGT